jgi:hypothetical protein
MKVADVLKINEHMIDAFMWTSISFEPLMNPTLSRDMSISVSVAQAARVGRVPLNEVLYVLNLTAGEDEKRLLCELEVRGCEDSACQPDSPPRPRELLGLRDDDPRVVFVDVFPRVQHEEEPRPESH